MKIVVLKEADELETRVAMSPATVKKYQSLGFEVYVESDAGLKAGFTNELFQEQGATCFENSADLLAKADCLLSVTPPTPQQLKTCKAGLIVIGMLNSLNTEAEQTLYTKKHISALSLERLPRITRAQNMDCLSSQSNLAGYQSVIEASGHYPRVLPMMMTAAGMIKPAKVLVLGAGVAGLQAIATAKRLGAIVSAFDVRPTAREQVESLAAEFIEVDDKEQAETSGGYAKEMSDAYKIKQQNLINEYAIQSNIVISTALIPNRQAPKLLSSDTVKAMEEGAVIVDLATSAGGNCELSVKNKVIKKFGKTIIGYEQLARHLATTASELYAANCFHCVSMLVNKESSALSIDASDAIIDAILVTHQGEIHNNSQEA